MEFSDSHYDKMNLDELFDICKQDKQNESAWKSLKNQLERYLMTIAQKKFTARIDDINDAISETIEVLYENIDRLRHCGWKRYLSVVFINKLIKSITRKRAEQSLEDLLQNLDSKHKIGNTKINDRPLVDTIIDIHEAIKKLPGDHQKVIILRYFHNLKNEEIAEQIGKTVHAVENMLYRIRKELSELLKDYDSKT